MKKITQGEDLRQILTIYKISDTLSLDILFHIEAEEKKYYIFHLLYCIRERYIHFSISKLVYIGIGCRAKSKCR